MRRKDREITYIEKLRSIIDGCDVCRLAMIDNGIPYIVPLNFGYKICDGELFLYFHCANEGRKLDILKRNPYVCFEMDCQHRLIEGEIACDYGFSYQSIIGNGTAEFIKDFEEKKSALTQIMRKYSNEESFHFSDNSVKNVTVFCVKSQSFTGKEH